MEGEANFSAIAPTTFDGTNYQIWAVRMETYLEALDLWKEVEEDYEVLAVTPQKYPRFFFYNFIIYSGYKLSQLGYFQGINK